MARNRNALYVVWWNMINRCYSRDSERYERYGGRGIAVCDEWLNDFKAFQEWALSTGYSDGLTIDRIDNDGNYEPGNCRWATVKEQANNRSSNRICSYKGFTGTMSEVCEKFGFDYGLINARIQKGWSEEDAFSTPRGAPTAKKNHMITFRGKTQTVSEWTKELGFKKNTLSERLRNGYSIERALTEPVRRRREKNVSE